MSSTSKLLRERERPVPPAYKFRVEADFYRQFTWRQRLQILLGYRVLLRAVFYTLHSPGKFHPTLELKTTRELLPTDHVDELKL